MLNLQRLFPIFILLIVTLQSGFTQTKTSDALDQWRSLVKKSAIHSSAVKKADIYNVISSASTGREIRISANRNFNQLTYLIEEAIILDNNLIDNIARSNDPDLIFSAFEFKFHLIINVQKRLTELFRNLDTPGKLLNIAVYYTMYYECTAIKSKLLYDLLSLVQMNNSSAKLKAWTSIERMMSEIDFKKCDSGEKQKQASATGIFLKPAEIMNFLARVNLNETNNDVKLLSSECINRMRTAGNLSKDVPGENDTIFLKAGNEQKVKQTTEIIAMLQKADSISDEESRIKIYDEIIARDSTIHLAYLNRGLSYYKLSNLQKAISDYNSAIRNNGWNGSPYLYRGIIFQQKGDYKNAINDFTKALELDPYLFSAYSYRGIAYQKTSQYEKAIQDFSLAIESDSAAIANYINRAICFASLKSYSNAEFNLNIAIRLSPQNASAYYNLGNIYYFKKDYANAIRNWETCYKLDKKFADVPQKIEVVKRKMSGT